MVEVGDLLMLGMDLGCLTVAHPMLVLLIFDLVEDADSDTVNMGKSLGVLPLLGAALLLTVVETLVFVIKM